MKSEIRIPEIRADPNDEALCSGIDPAWASVSGCSGCIDCSRIATIKRSLMGLDTVELVMEFEDEFEISIPDDDAERIQTLGETFDYIVRRLEERTPPGVCPSAHAFYQLRRELHRECGVERGRVKPDSMIGELVPPGPERRRWRGIAKRMGLPVPSLDIRHPLSPRFPPEVCSVREIVNSQQVRKFHKDAGLVDSEAVWNKICTIVGEQMQVDVKELNRDTHYIHHLGAG